MTTIEIAEIFGLQRVWPMRRNLLDFSPSFFPTPLLFHLQATMPPNVTA